MSCPPPGDLPDPGRESVSLTSPALGGEFFTTSTTWEALVSSAGPSKAFKLGTNTIRAVLRKKTRQEINGELPQVRDQRPVKSLEDDYSNQVRE